MILKAIALIYLGIGGLSSLAVSFHLLPYPDIGPLIGYVAIATFLVTVSGIIYWEPIKKPKDPFAELDKLRRRANV